MVTLKRSIILFFLTLTACTQNTPNVTVVVASPVPPTPLSATATASPPTATPIPMAIVINDEGITLDDFNAEVTRYKTALTAMGKTFSEDEAIQVVTDDLVSQLLLAQGAAEAGFVLDEPMLQQRLETLMSQIGGPTQLTAWQQAHGYSEASFNLAIKRAAASAWMREKIISAVPGTAEQVHIRQILLYNEDVAKSYYDRLQSGADFDELAAAVDPNTHGDIGWFPRGYLAEKTVEDAAFSLEVGTYSSIIPSEVGFHILKLLDRQPERGLSPDALSVMQKRALIDWLAARRQQSNVVLAP